MSFQFVRLYDCHMKTVTLLQSYDDVKKGCSIFSDLSSSYVVLFSAFALIQPSCGASKRLSAERDNESGRGDQMPPMRQRIMERGEPAC